MPYTHLRSRALRLILGTIAAFVVVLPAWGVAADTAIAQQVGSGAPVTFSGTGFTANESLSAWQTGPDGAVTSIPNIQTDASGTFSVTVSFPATGQWQVTAHSILSGKEYVGQYAVGTTASTTTTNTPVSSSVTPLVAPPAPSPVASSAALPITLSAPFVTNPLGAIPQTVVIGAPVPVSSNGFTANEPIAFWKTAPDGAVTPFAGGTADGNGAISTTVSFPTAGQWQVTAHGVTSARDFVGRYAVVPTAGATAAIPGTLLPPVSPVGTNTSSVLPGDTVAAPAPPIVRVK